MLLLLAAAVPTSAQTIAGQAVDARSGEPIAAADVRLLAVRGDSMPRIVDSTVTDLRGLFEFLRIVPGVYQVEFGPWAAPWSRGPVDTTDARGAPRRRYEVPVPLPQATPPAVVRGVTPPAVTPPVATSPAGGAVPMAGAPARTPRRQPLVRVVLSTTVGTALGAGAGFATAALRCGRHPTCTPLETYPYTAVGAVLGATIGGGSAARQERCAWAFARSLAGSVAGSLAGSIGGGDRAAQKRIVASAGALVGSVAALSTCRFG